ncbi:RidA family protein [Vibrio mediterranei]|uniref:RidA family protein n=1 Tax=Vibrio mediterranei TaxID=689 RepID=UPI00148CBA6F|nr:Rid family detoxifying hydrolase [Vibrio mediterranei]NOI26663.1 RidA family protein [Vibrio mediterranei]
MKVVQTNNALTPAGHYSQAIVHDNLLYISGQLPINKETGDKVLGAIEEQTLCVLDNVKCILAEVNSELDDVLKMVVYISDVTMWDAVNAVFAKYFGEHRPVRTIVPTRDLHYGFNIEVDCIAVTKNL